MLWPPRMISSFFRPVSQKVPSASCLPRSPVLNHPSSSHTPLLCSSSRYPGNTFGPLTQTHPISSVAASRHPVASSTKIFIPW
mgnify:CR=1 FL=1